MLEAHGPASRLLTEPRGVLLGFLACAKEGSGTGVCVFRFSFVRFFRFSLFWRTIFRFRKTKNPEIFSFFSVLGFGYLYKFFYVKQIATSFCFMEALFKGPFILLPQRQMPRRSNDEG